MGDLGEIFIVMKYFGVALTMWMKNLNLIRDYVIKIIGEQNAVVSEIKKNEIETSGKNYFLEFLIY